MLAEVNTDTEEKPAEASLSQGKLSNFLASVAAAPQSILLLDFDGTLAPFRRDPAKVKPWSSVVTLLDAIQATGRTRLALVSGRPAQDVSARLCLSAPTEVWGLHGAERLFPDGHMEFEKLPLRKQILLNAARTALQESGLTVHSGIRIETKWNAVAAHFRGLTAHAASVAAEKVQAILQPFTEDQTSDSSPDSSPESPLEMLVFDGGIELRAGRHKGDAVRQLLAESAPGTPAAYLGDDTTDENAFEAIAEHGLSILVRRQWRPTAADLWIRPPEGLRQFLRGWLAAIHN
jgi:trehalose 6-phosphate synthase/trehalose 6-phosphate phosphatase